MQMSARNSFTYAKHMAITKQGGRSSRSRRCTNQTTLLALQAYNYIKIEIVNTILRFRKKINRSRISKYFSTKVENFKNPNPTALKFKSPPNFFHNNANNSNPFILIITAGKESKGDGYHYFGSITDLSIFGGTKFSLS